MENKTRAVFTRMCVFVLWKKDANYCWFSMKRKKYGRPRPSRRRTAPGGETATGTGWCDVDDLDHVDDVNSDVTQSPNTEWPHQNSPCIKCMLLHVGIRPVLYSRYLVELRNRKNIQQTWPTGSRLLSAFGAEKAAKSSGAAAWRRTSRKNFGQKSCENVGITLKLYELNIDRLTTHLQSWHGLKKYPALQKMKQQRLSKT